MAETRDSEQGGRRGGRRGARYKKDWTKGSIIGNLLSLAGPMMVTDGLNMMGPTIDMVWVGRLGAAAIAGVGISGMLVGLVNSARRGLSTGERAMIARFIGAGDEEGANHIAQQAFVVTFTFAAFLAAIGVIFARPILLVMGLEADVVEEGAAYMRIMFVGSLFMSLRIMCETVMESSGDAMTPMRVAMFFRFFHVALCPFLVFGWWIFPRMGVTGAAMTNVVSQSLGTAIGLWFLFSGRTRLRLTLKNFHLDLPIIWRMVKIGIPATITGMERSFANLVMMTFIVPFGTLAVAAHSLCRRIESFVHMPTQGLGMASGVLAGQNLGAQQPGRSERTGWLAVGLVTAVMAVASIATWFWAEGMVGIFNSEPGLVEIASIFLRIQIAGYLVFGLAAGLAQCLNGVGDTVITMVVTLVAMWAVQVPLGYFLPKIGNLGVNGVRWAMVIALVVRAFTYAVYFRMGRWKRKKV
ncbi:MAG: MATE family efflux transporter [Dehalococcoidales bacterium]|nr:MAG: MATE family efflux transporter [Dehalococcoidales bacterium]